MDPKILKSSNPYRSKRWNKVNMKIDKMIRHDDLEVPPISSYLYRIGYLDCFLVEKEKEIDKDELLSFNEIAYLSRLWVLDLYELLRILKYKSDHFKKFHDEIKSIRIPLAKNQKAGNKIDFFPVAILEEPSNKISWITPDDKIFTRSVFSDKFLKYFEDLS
jgi:hypothetical protein